MDFSGSAVTIVDVYRICNEPAIYLNSPVNDSGLKIGGAILLNLNRKEYTTPSWARIREAPSNDDVNMYHSVSTDKQSVPVGISLNLAYALKLDFRFPEQLTLDVVNYVPEVKPINYVSLKVDWVQNYRNQQRDKYLKVYEKLPEDSDSQFPNSDQLRDVLSGTLIYLDQKFLLRWLNRTLIVIVQKVLFKHNAKMKEGAPILGEITNSTKIEMEKEPLDGLLDAERPKSPDIRPKVSLTSNSTSLLGANGVVRRIELFLDDAWDGENLLGVLVTGKIGVGKTTFACNIAEHLNISSYTISCRKLIQEDELESLIVTLLRRWTGEKHLVVILDDIDKISENVNPVKIMLQFIDHFRIKGPKTSKIVFIGTSTIYDKPINELLRSGRFSDVIGTINLTLALERKEIFESLSKNIVFKGESRESLIDYLSEKTFAFQASDIQHLIQQAVSSKLKNNEEVELTRADFEKVLEWKKPSQLGEFSISVPRVTFDELFGMEDIVSQIKKKIINPFANFESVSSLSLPKGALIHGPPGVGKSALCFAIINQLGFNCVYVEGARIRSKVVGETEKAIYRIFNDARSNAPCAILIDQVDVLLRKREGSSESDMRLVTSFLTEMDGISTASVQKAALPPIFILAVTNKFEEVDKAIIRPGRLDLSLHIRLPKLEQRREILFGLLKGIPSNISPEEMQDLARNLDGYSGGDIDNLIREAVLQCLRESIDSAEINISHLLKLL